MSQAVRFSPCQHDVSVGVWRSLQLTLRAFMGAMEPSYWYGIASVDVITHERADRPRVCEHKAFVV